MPHKVKQSKKTIQKVQSIEEELLVAIIKCMDDNKIENITEQKCPGNYFVGRVVIGTGSSTRHISGAAEKVSILLKQEYGLLPILDTSSKEWVVMVCGSIAIHFMTQEKREHYKIEQLINSIDKNV